MLKISLNLGLDTSYKLGRFSKTLLEKGLKFILNRRSAIIFDLSFVLLPVGTDLVAKKQSCRKYAF